MPHTLMPNGPIDRRRHRRIQVLLAVEVQSDGVPQLVRLTELSQRGARLMTYQSLPVGEPIVLKRAGVALEGRVSWGRGISYGVEFAAPLDETSYLRMKRSPGHAN